MSAGCDVKTVAQRWDDFERRVIAPDGLTIQSSGMRVAFYAGAKAMLDAGLEIAEIADDQRCVALLESFHQECREFGAQQRAGNA